MTSDHGFDASFDPLGRLGPVADEVIDLIEVHPFDLGFDLVVAGEDESRAAVTNDVPPVFGLLHFVHGDNYSAQAVGRISRERERDGVDRDAVAFFHAELVEGCSEPFHLLLKAAVRDPMPFSFYFLPKQFSRAVQLSGAVYEMGKVLYFGKI